MFIDRCLEISKYVLINIPIGKYWEQSITHNNLFQRHLSIWYNSDFKKYEYHKIKNFRDFHYRKFSVILLSKGKFEYKSNFKERFGKHFHSRNILKHVFHLKWLVEKMERGEKIKVIFIGKYDKSEILAGNIKVAKRIFYHYTKGNRSLFIEYYFDGSEYSYFRKLFGSEVIEEVNGSKVLKLGIIKMLLTLFKLRPDIVHVMIAERFCAFAYFYKLLKKVKFYFNVHGLQIYEDEKLRKPPKFFKIKNRIAEKIFLKYSDIIFVLSKRSQKLVNEYYKVDQNKFRIIPNGIDEVFSQYADKRTYRNDNKLKLVFGSGINRIEKGFSFLIDSLQEINYSIDFFILSKKYPLIFNNITNPKIKLLYFDRMSPVNLAKFFLDKDVFISSSFYDHFNTTAVESMATGVIPILTNETGASEYIKDGISGYTFDYGDKEKLQSIMLFLIGNPDVLKDISLRAKEIYNLLSWEKVMKIYKKYYEEK